MANIGTVVRNEKIRWDQIKRVGSHSDAWADYGVFEIPIDASVTDNECWLDCGDRSYLQWGVSSAGYHYHAIDRDRNVLIVRERYPLGD